jgi:mannosyl-oligosaccharide glucosidase
MNVNVLAVLRLQKLGTQDRDRSNKPTPIQKRILFIAAELRERVIHTVYRSWETTGFVWEQYKDGTGEGTHSRAFTGWTACVVLLMGLNITKDSGNRQGVHGFSFQTLNWTVTSMASFVLIMALRRRLMALAVYIAKYWHNWTDNWSARQRYEQVIDLEEREA